MSKDIGLIAWINSIDWIQMAILVLLIQIYKKLKFTWGETAEVVVVVAGVAVGMWIFK